MGNQYQAKPTHDVGPISNVTASSPVTPSLDESQTVFDSSRAIRLLARDVVAYGQQALATNSVGQMLATMQRAHDVVREITLLSNLATPGARSFALDVAMIKATAKSLATRLAPDPNLASRVAILETEIDTLEQRSGVEALSEATVASITVKERIELVRQELAATREQVGIITERHPVDRGAASELCAPLQFHLAEAIYSTLKIQDRTTREPLYMDVERVSTDMDRLARILSIEPGFKWHASFAAAFDSENRLRAAVGLTAKVRPYSGNIDPAAARAYVLDASKRIESGDDSTESVAGPMSNQGYVNTIVRNISFAYSAMAEQMRSFERNFSVTDPPSFDIGDALLNISLNILLGAAATGVAGFIGKKLGDALVAAPPALAILAQSPAGKGLSEEAIQHMFDHMSAKNAFSVDTAKDAFTRVLTKTTDLASFSRGSENAVTLLGAFVQNTQSGLSDGSMRVMNNLEVLRTPLSQLDLSILSSLAGTTRTLVDEVPPLIYGKAFVEWEKLLAENALSPGRTNKGVEPKEPILNAQRQSPWQDSDIPGVLQINLNVSADNQIRASGMRLQGTQPAGRQWLREHPELTKNVGINRIFNVAFDSLSYRTSALTEVLMLRSFITLGVSASSMLQTETIDELEWLRLRLFAANQEVDHLHETMLAVDDHRAKTDYAPTEMARVKLAEIVSRDVATKAAYRLITFGDNLKTSEVEA